MQAGSLPEPPKGVTCCRAAISRDDRWRAKTERLPVLHVHSLKYLSPVRFSSTLPTPGTLMSVALDRRLLLRLVLCCSIAALGIPAVAAMSETTAPVEQLHAGLIEIMKAGKSASFRQRYDKIAPVITKRVRLTAAIRQIFANRP